MSLQVADARGQHRQCDAPGCRWAPVTIGLRGGGGRKGSGGLHPLPRAPVRDMHLTRPPAKAPLHKEPEGSTGPPPARPDLAPGPELRIPTKWCLTLQGECGYHFRDANQNPHGTDCARRRGLQSGEACGGLRVSSCSRAYLLIRGAGDLWRAARNPKAATRPKATNSQGAESQGDAPRCVPSRKGLPRLDHR